METWDSQASVDIVVFRFVAYLLNTICLILSFYTKLHIYEFSYKFDTVLYQFIETGTSDRCLICIVQCLWFSGFIHTPFHFSFTVPLKHHAPFYFDVMTCLFATIPFKPLPDTGWYRDIICFLVQKLIIAFYNHETSFVYSVLWSWYSTRKIRISQSYMIRHQTEVKKGTVVDRTCHSYIKVQFKILIYVKQNSQCVKYQNSDCIAEI